MKMKIMFGIAFKTPPKDSTGVAHILEHTVLCGSKKYPVKDQFVQLRKVLQTISMLLPIQIKHITPFTESQSKRFP